MKKFKDYFQSKEAELEGVHIVPCSDKDNNMGWSAIVDMVNDHAEALAKLQATVEAQGKRIERLERKIYELPDDISFNRL